MEEAAREAIQREIMKDVPAHEAAVALRAIGIDASEFTVMVERLMTAWAVRFRREGRITDLPVRLVEQMPSDWLAAGPDTGSVNGTIESYDEETGTLRIEFEWDKPEGQSTSMIVCQLDDLKPMQPNPDDLSPEAVAADPVGDDPNDYAAEIARSEGIDTGRDARAATFVTKVFLVGRKAPVLIDVEFDEAKNVLIYRQGIWGGAKPWFKRVAQDGMLAGELIAINPDHVQSVSSEVVGE